MQFQSFDYIDAKGKKTDRFVLQLAAQDIMKSEYLEGIDLSSLGTDEFATAVEQFSDLIDKFKSDFNHLVTTLDLQHNYRMFKTSNITNLSTQTI